VKLVLGVRSTATPGLSVDVPRPEAKANGGVAVRAENGDIGVIERNGYRIPNRSVVRGARVGAERSAGGRPGGRRGIHIEEGIDRMEPLAALAQISAERFFDVQVHRGWATVCAAPNPMVRGEGAPRVPPARSARQCQRWQSA